MKAVTFVIAIGLALSGCAFSTGDDATTSQSRTFELFFDIDRAVISDDAAEILRQVADSAKRGDITVIDISVHSAAAGWDAHSQALSERRAEAVRGELIKDGVPAAQIGRVDVGKSHLVPTDDGVREPQNRRTEIILR